MSTEQIELKLIPARDAAELMGVSVQRLADWRSRGIGPRYVKSSDSQNAKILYPYKAIMGWIEEHTVDPSKGK